MKKTAFIVIAFCSVLLARDLYVSLEGSDGAAGAGSKERPFASVSKAVEQAVKFIELRGYPEDGITINIAPGVYRFNETINIGSEFSGTEDAPIVFRAQKNADVWFVGGEKLSLRDFSKVTDASIRKRLHSDIADEIVMFDLKKKGIYEYGRLPLYGHSMVFLESQTKYHGGHKAPELFFNDEPMTIARWPNEEFTRVEKVISNGDVIRDWMDDRKELDIYVPMEKRRDPPRGFTLKLDKTRLQRWAQAKDLRLYGYWFYNWSDQSVEVARIDPESSTLTSLQPSAYGVRSGQRFYAYNLLEELDKPGEWYLDRESGIIYLIPIRNDPNASLHLSLLSEPFMVFDSASHVRIEGLNFGYSRGTGLIVNFGRDVRVTNCKVANIGGVAVRLNGGLEHAVVDCEVFNTGDGGIMVYGGNIDNLTPSKHLVKNNLIYNYARIKKTYSPAIGLDGVGNIALHNEIHSGAHLAIMFGGNDHLIEFNHIYDVARETDDMAAIDAARSWTARGTVIRYNLFRDITGYKSGTHRVSGVYFDDGISGNTVDSNIFLNVAQGMIFNGGRDNIAVNNVFIDVENMIRSTNLEQAYKTWAASSWVTLNKRVKEVPYDKEPWLSAYPNLANILKDDPQLPKYTVIKDNLRYNTPLIMGKDGITDAVVKYGTVENNITIDKKPGSYDPVSGRFNFDPSSGVFEAMSELKKIPTEKIGRMNR